MFWSVLPVFIREQKFQFRMEKPSDGRTADNDLVFENQQKVSRKHCVISFHRDKECFKIVDTSSNGSFTNGSQECLPQNMEICLKPGTILDFGSEENRFRLE